MGPPWSAFCQITLTSCWHLRTGLKLNCLNLATHNCFWRHHSAPDSLAIWHVGRVRNLFVCIIIIIIIIITTTMFMVLSSWQSHCESSPGSFDECMYACCAETVRLYCQSYYRTLIGSRVCSVQWCHPRWLWSTFQGHTRRRCLFCPVKNKNYLREIVVLAKVCVLWVLFRRIDWSNR